MMHVFFLSINPEMQNLEDCLQNLLSIFQAFLFKNRQKALNSTVWFSVPTRYYFTVNKLILNTVRNDERYYETEKERRYEDDDDESF